MGDPTITVTDIGALHEDEANPRQHNPGNIGLIADSLQDVGVMRSLVVDEDDNILAGNGTYEAASQVGLEQVIMVETDGDALIVHKRRGLTPDQKLRYKILDNAATDRSSWALARMAEIAETDRALLAGIFTDEDVAQFLAWTPPQEATLPGAGGDEFDATPQPGPTRTHLGELWQLGPHRLLIGDSTDPAQVERLMAGQEGLLMATDPPYGVNFKGQKYNPRAKNWDAIEGDTLQGDTLTTWLAGCITVWRAYMSPQAAYYFWTAAMEEGAAAYQAIKQAGLHVQSQIIWAKNVLVLGQADYQWKHENCWYAFQKGAQHRWLGGRAQTTVWEISKVANALYQHPMQKPLELYALPMRNHTHPNEICVDPFAGSGSQLIAGTREGRRVYAMELDPVYGDVILRRAEAEGIGPIQLLESLDDAE